jgi:hypothetical protein
MNDYKIVNVSTTLKMVATQAKVQHDVAQAVANPESAVMLATAVITMAGRAVWLYGSTPEANMTEVFTAYAQILDGTVFVQMQADEWGAVDFFWAKPDGELDGAEGAGWDGEIPPAIQAWLVEHDFLAQP